MTRPTKPITVLLADDDADDRQMIQEAFDVLQYSNDLRFVIDGAELMDYLQHRTQYADPQCAPKPGLILLDLNMPKKDGREALQEIRSDPRLKNIRVVVMSTSKAAGDIHNTYDLGASSYIVKPESFDALVDVIKSIGKYWLEIVELPNGTGVIDHG